MAIVNYQRVSSCFQRNSIAMVQSWDSSDEQCRKLPLQGHPPIWKGPIVYSEPRVSIEFPRDLGFYSLQMVRNEWCRSSQFPGFHHDRLLVAGREDSHREQQRWDEGTGREGHDALGEVVLLLGAVTAGRCGHRLGSGLKLKL